MALDALGRKRSSRSTSTGPGSRGGQWHVPAWRQAYFRAWRAAHPDYRKRRRDQDRERNLQDRLARDRLLVDDDIIEQALAAIRSRIVAEMERRHLSIRALSRRSGSNHQPIAHLIAGHGNPLVGTIVLMADALGYDVKIVRRRRARRRPTIAPGGLSDIPG